MVSIETLPELRTDLRLCSCGKKDFELPFGCPSRGRHQAKDAKNDIRHLADLIFIEGSISRKDGRSCAHKSLNLFGNGTNVILSSAVSKFNEQLLERAADMNMGGDACRSFTGDCAENASGHANEAAREDCEGILEDDDWSDEESERAVDTDVGIDAISTGDCAENVSGYPNEAAREYCEGDVEDDDWSDRESDEEELGCVMPPQEAQFFSLQVNSDILTPKV